MKCLMYGDHLPNTESLSLGIFSNHALSLVITVKDKFKKEASCNRQYAWTFTVINSSNNTYFKPFCIFMNVFQWSIIHLHRPRLFDTPPRVINYICIWEMIECKIKLNILLLLTECRLAGFSVKFV
jgi:hypothetical protein